MVIKMISREKLIRLLNQKKAEYSSSNYKQIRRGICKAISIAHNMPTVDAVEVVQCKDCIHFKYDDYCDHDKMEHSFCREDDYCSYGERKMDAEVQDEI